MRNEILLKLMVLCRIVLKLGGGMTILGRIQVFKSLALSKATFVSVMIPNMQKFTEFLTVILKVLFGV